MPNHYIGKNFDLAGFSVGIVEKKLIIDSSKVRKNNIIIGIESSGAHSNGYSLINKLIKESLIIVSLDWIFKLTSRNPNINPKL